MWNIGTCVQTDWELSYFIWFLWIIISILLFDVGLWSRKLNWSDCLNMEDKFRFVLLFISKSLQREIILDLEFINLCSMMMELFIFIKYNFKKVINLQKYFVKICYSFVFEVLILYLFQKLPFNFIIKIEEITSIWKRNLNLLSLFGLKWLKSEITSDLENLPMYILGWQICYVY